MIAWRWVWAVAIVVGSAGAAQEQRPLAPTPPLGWNSYDAFGDSVTEAEMIANARALAAALKPHGWQYVVVDYNWFDPKAFNNQPNQHGGKKLPADDYGRLLPAVNRFPSATGASGFTALAERVHQLGLKFGIHIMRGIPRQALDANTPIEGSAFHAADAANPKSTCSWSPFMYGVKGDTPAGQAWYDSIFRQYAGWGVDFVKVDDLTRPYSASEVEAIHRAILKCGRPIVFSTSPGETPVKEAAHVAANADMWRATDDFWDHWNQLDAAFTFADRWSTQTLPPGHWPDLDMLPLGHLSVGHRSVDQDRQTRFAPAEQQLMLTLWALVPSPLMLGGNLADADAAELALLTNDEVLAINQDKGNKRAHRTMAKQGVETWERELADGSKAVGVFNRNNQAAEEQVSVPAGTVVRDCWGHRNLTPVDGHVVVSLPAHGAALLRWG